MDADTWALVQQAGLIVEGLLEEVDGGFRLSKKGEAEARSALRRLTDRERALVLLLTTEIVNNSGQREEGEK